MGMSVWLARDRGGHCSIEVREKVKERNWLHGRFHVTIQIQLIDRNKIISFDKV